MGGTNRSRPRGASVMRMPMHPRRPLRTFVTGAAAAALAATLVPFVGPAPAGAAERDLDARKEAAHAAIVSRTTALDRAIVIVHGSGFMGDDAASRVAAM